MTTDQERAALVRKDFEAELRRVGYHYFDGALMGPIGHEDWEYSSAGTQHAWKGWQAARAAPAEAQSKSEPAASDVARLDFLEQTFREKSAVWLLPCGAGLTFLQIRTFEREIVNFETVPGGVRAAIDAAIAATQEQQA